MELERNTLILYINYMVTSIKFSVIFAYLCAFLGAFDIDGHKLGTGYLSIFQPAN
jgi:hypothetical protein